ncbi:hypothetical protein D3C71_1897910 [compost metagenome]
MRIFRQHAVERGRVAQAVLIEPAASRRERMVMQQQQGMAFRCVNEFAFEPLQLEIAQLAVRHAEDLGIQQQNLPVIAHKHTLGR